MAHMHADTAGTRTRHPDPATERGRQPVAVPTGAPTAPPRTPLSLKALRMAVHGWWLGNPLVYKPGAPDLMAVARELSAAGVASGAIIVSDAPAALAAARPVPAPAARPSSYPDQISAVLVLRPPLPLSRSESLPSDTALEAAVLIAVAETTRDVLAHDPSRVRTEYQPPRVILGPAGDQPTAELCSVEVDQHADVVYVGLRFALDQLRLAGVAGNQDEGEQLATGARFLARSDWREIYLARVLHALEGHIRELS